jgi:hypothetical protein
VDDIFVKIRVNRLGEMGDGLLWAGFYTTEVAQIFGLRFMYKVKVMY